MTDRSKPTFFDSPAAFRRWFEGNSVRNTELLVGFYKKGSGKPSITWPEAVDEALCFGWIDGIRKGLDSVRYTIRFTPRKRRSTWSAINVARVADLTKQGRMTPQGLEAFAQRDEKRSALYSYEQRAAAKLETSYAEAFRANERAWEFFRSRPPSYQKAATWWVMSAKKEETRRRRLAIPIRDSARGRAVPPLTPPGRARRP